MKKIAILTVVLALTGCWPAVAGAQDAKAVLEAAATTLGASTLKSIEFSGRGFDYIFGQPYDGDSPWPRFAVPAITKTIDFVTPAMRDDRRRQQVQNPPLGGGFQPLAGELRQIWLLSGAYAWDQVGSSAVAAAPERDFRTAVDGRLAQIWMTPHGFVKAAMAAGATARTETLRGVKKTVISFTAPNKARFEAVIDGQNLVERIETWFGSPVLGDTKLEAVFSGYKDFGGVMFPTHIVQREGGYPVLDLTVTDVHANVPVVIDVPASIRQAPAPGPEVVQGEKLSDGVWMFQGGAKSIAIEFTDHVVVVDAPETEARSILVIDAIKRAIPGKPITHVINTHQHFDHAGGLRTYAAEGAAIVTQAANIPFYEQHWTNPRTIAPDRLARSGRKPVFEGVVGSRTMRDGARELVIYHYAGNMHNAGMLMVFLPREKMLLEADSWTPPAAPNEAPGGAPNLVHFYDAVERLQLDVEQVVPMHGRITTWDDVRQAVKTFGDSPWAASK